MQFTLYWKTGDREIVHGRNVAEAMTLAGYSGGAIGALDRWARGDDKDCYWDANHREWKSRRVDEAIEAIGTAKIMRPWVLPQTSIMEL